jgi:hypothetical protein
MKITIYEVDTGYFIADNVEHGKEFGTGELKKSFTKKREAEKCFRRETKRLRCDDVDWFAVTLTEKTFDGSPRAIVATANGKRQVENCAVSTKTLDAFQLTELEVIKRSNERIRI